MILHWLQFGGLTVRHAEPGANAPQHLGAGTRLAIAFLPALLLPWLNPFTSGPTPAVLPWLVSAACAVLVWQFSTALTPRTIATSWLLAAMISALMGAMQYFGQTQALSPWVHATDMGEAFGNLRQRNQFATLTSIGLLALLWYADDTQQAPARALHVLRLAPWALLLALGNAASGSRTGLLQWLLIVALSVLWCWRGKRQLVMLAGVALAGYLVAVLALPWLLEVVTGTSRGGLLARFNEATGCSSRKVLWANVLHLIAQKPWLGWGWGELGYAHFSTLYPGDSGERFCELLDNAHNLPLHLAVELGVPFSVAVCGGLLWGVWRGKPWLERDASRQLAWGVLGVIGLHSLLEYPLWYGPFQLAVALSAWLLWHRKRGALDENHKEKSLAGRIFIAWTATVLIAFIGYAAWDYQRISQIYKVPAMRSEAYRDDTLAKIRGSRLFANQVRFAELTTTPLTRDNAAEINALAHRVLHFSPEARVVEKLIESAVMLGRDDEALFFLQRLKAAYPDEHARWAKENAETQD